MKLGFPGWLSIRLHIQNKLERTKAPFRTCPFLSFTKDSRSRCSKFGFNSCIIHRFSIKSWTNALNPPKKHLLFNPSSLPSTHRVSPWWQCLLFCTYTVQNYSWVCPTTTTRVDNTQKSCIDSHYSYTSFYFWPYILPKRNLETVSIALLLRLPSDSCACAKTAINCKTATAIFKLFWGDHRKSRQWTYILTVNIHCWINTQTIIYSVSLYKSLLVNSVFLHPFPTSQAQQSMSKEHMNKQLS